MKTFDMWETGDEETGLHNYIRRESLVLLIHLKALVASTFLGPEHVHLVTTLHALYALTFNTVTDFCMEITKLQHHLAFQTFSTIELSPEEKKECWEFVLVAVGVWCLETSQARVCFRQINSYTDPLQANSLALYAAVQELQVCAKFKAYNFREHPKIFPKFQTQFIQKCVRKAEVAKIKKTVASFAATIKRLEGVQSKLKTQVGRLATQVGNCELKDDGKKGRKSKGAGEKGGEDIDA
jgi:hypothetical protein